MSSSSKEKSLDENRLIGRHKANFNCRGGGMADAADLKSVGGNPVPVQVRPSVKDQSSS
jgi:hypothetical protein